MDGGEAGSILGTSRSGNQHIGRSIKCITVLLYNYITTKTNSYGQSIILICYNIDCY